MIAVVNLPHLDQVAIKTCPAASLSTLLDIATLIYAGGDPYQYHTQKPIPRNPCFPLNTTDIVRYYPIENISHGNLILKSIKEWKLIFACVTYILLEYST